MIDPKDFVEALAKQIADALRRGASECKENRLGAVVVEPHPWHKGMCLSLLIDTDELRKWNMGDWEYQEFAVLGGIPVIEQGYEDLRDADETGSEAYRPFFRCCAEALCHKAVEEALKGYTLEPDFELFVADPDDPNEANSCDDILGVDRAKRKKKTGIVGDLKEALKDPESVLILKYWHGELGPSEEKGIARLTNLEDLYLSYRDLKTLPECVRSLKKLKRLHLDSNQLTRLDGLDCLPDLRVLHLRDSKSITSDMAEVISRIASLRVLGVSSCRLTKVPDSWQRLMLLEELYLFENPLHAIPEWLPALPHLKCLALKEAADEDTKAELRRRHPNLEIT